MRYRGLQVHEVVAHALDGGGMACFLLPQFLGDLTKHGGRFTLGMKFM